MAMNEQFLQTGGSTYPPVFIAAIGYVMFVFVYTETREIKRGNGIRRGKWLAFILAQVIIGVVPVGEWGESTFVPTLVVVLLEYLACYIAWFLAMRSKDKSE
jgi:hypothetical protein